VKSPLLTDSAAHPDAELKEYGPRGKIAKRLEGEEEKPARSGLVFPFIIVAVEGRRRRKERKEGSSSYSSSWKRRKEKQPSNFLCAEERIGGEDLSSPLLLVSALRRKEG